MRCGSSTWNYTPTKTPMEVKASTRLTSRLLLYCKEISRSGEHRVLRFDADVVILGSDWYLVTMPHKMFCEYELWVEQTAPFQYTMTLGYTNGCESYVADDTNLAMGVHGAYEAGAFPSLMPAARIYRIRLPLAVGTEKLIKETVEALWQ